MTMTHLRLVVRCIEPPSRLSSNLVTELLLKYADLLQMNDPIFLPSDVLVSVQHSLNIPLAHNGISSEPMSNLTLPPEGPIHRQTIAIVGMATVFPEAHNVDELWHLLETGLNTASKIPLERFDVSRYVDGEFSDRSMHPTLGNFIADPDVFDHTFFHISPREARSMDPQQRLLLRVSYHALENAGYVPGATPSFDPVTFATYLGVATSDYVQNLRNNIDVYYSTGTLHSFLSGKVAYAFGFGGPCISMDTACSGSIVAIHQACRALQSGDCNAALAGGVNIITSPDMYLGLARGHFLSKTGQCRPWDADADGYSRAEGCGMFVLKRLDDALAENDRILGVIRAIEVNQSGNARSITQPHVPAQVALFEKVVRSAGVHPHDINVAECHGTGTQAGDPAELEAIRKVFAVGRTADNPLHITSIKANIGHAEAASGAASLTKLVMMIRKKTIPRHVSFKRLNPKIPDLTIDNVRIHTVNVPWTCESKRLALLTNYGAAGSNSALILEELVDPPRSTKDLRRTGVVVGLAARGIAAAEKLRETYIAQLERGTDQISLHDFAYSATARQQLHKYRIAASGRSKDEVLASLGVAKVIEVAPTEKVLFVFSGQGSQYPGMGADLYREVPLIAKIVNECDRKLVGWGYPGVLDVFRESHGPPHGDDEDRQFESMQAALFVLEYALAELLMSWGVRPAALIGHSFGEYAALVVAGVLTIDDGLKLVAVRARLLAQKCVKQKTNMSSVRASPERLAPLLATSGVEVCCFNSASHCTVGGPIDFLEHFDALCAAQRIRCTHLDIPFAYHSDAMEPIIDDLCAFGRDVQLLPPRIPVLSNVTGTLLQPGDEATLDYDYFARHCREPARFHQGIVDLQSHMELSDVAACIELGAHPTTVPLLRSTQMNGAPLLLSALRKDTPEFETLCDTLAQLYCTAVPVNWRNVFADLAPTARLIDLPSYPFSTTSRFWVPYEEDPQQQVRPVPIARRPRYGILDRCISIPPSNAGGTALFETDIATVADLIQGHRVAGVGLCPASVYAELALSAASSVFEARSASSAMDVLSLSEVVFPKALVYDPERPTKFRIEINMFEPSQNSKHAGSFTISSFEDTADTLQTCCSGFFCRTTIEALSSKLAYSQSTVVREIGRMTSQTLSLTVENFSTRTLYGKLFSMIVDYSEQYQSIRSATIDASTSAVYAIVQLPNARAPLASGGPFVIHPIFIDSVLHVAGFLVNFTFGMNERDGYICSQVDGVKFLYAELDVSAMYGVYASVTYAAKSEVVADVFALTLDEPRRIVARIKRVRFRKVAMASLKRVLGATPSASQITKEVSRPAFLTPPPSARDITSPSRVDHPPRSVAPILAGAEARRLDEVFRIIAEVSGVAKDELTMQAELAQLGIDSLMIWELVARLRALSPRHGHDVDTHAFAQASTVGDLARIVSKQAGGETGMSGSSSADNSMTLCEADRGALLTPSDEDQRQLVSPAAGVVVVSAASVKEVLSGVLDVPAAHIADEAELESLGLDSMMSIEARHAFQTTFEVKIGEETMVDCRTVADIVKVLSATHSSVHAQPNHGDDNDTPTPPPNKPTTPELVRLQTAPAGCKDVPPLILIHDGSGFVGPYAKLSQLGRDVWGMQNASYGTCIALCSAPLGKELQAMATSYVDMLIDAFSWDEKAYRGQCFVGGWSFGGVVAYEIARQLLSRGVQVNGLILIDSPAPQTASPLSDEFIAAISQRVGGATARRTRERIQAQMRYATRALVGYNFFRHGASEAGALRAVFLRSGESVDVAAVSGLDARVRTFLTSKDDVWTVGSWEEALGARVDVLEIPGDHLAAFDEENVLEVSRQLKMGIQLLS